jgi:hypothetical protein
MIGNFFKVTCPFLYELVTVAYFGYHTRCPHICHHCGHTGNTQLLLDLYKVNNKLYVHR